MHPTSSAAALDSQAQPVSNDVVWTRIAHTKKKSTNGIVHQDGGSDGDAIRNGNRRNLFQRGILFSEATEEDGTGKCRKT